VHRNSTGKLKTMVKLFFVAALLFVCLQGAFSEYLRQDFFNGDGCDTQYSEVRYYRVGACLPYEGAYATVSYTDSSATFLTYDDFECLQSASYVDFFFGECSAVPSLGGNVISSIVPEVDFDATDNTVTRLTYNGTCLSKATILVADFTSPHCVEEDTQSVIYTCTETSAVTRTYEGAGCSAESPVEAEEALEACTEGEFVTFTACTATGTVPTSAPEVEPTSEPVDPTAEPVDPTAEPTEEPVDPTAEPTEEPVDPTAEPTEEPVDPTAEPTEEPVDPTAEPTEEPVDPTAEPTEEPVDPTAEPTEEPVDPTAEPTEEPTGEPTEEPTGEPTVEPTDEPTGQPTGVPTAEPTGEPTGEPTVEPTVEPTENPIATGSASSISFSVVLAFVGLLFVLLQ